ncbi:outer membrane beta-barrel family protein [Compostibacter hankyongensis]|uniref:Outer membrane beta-barrel family protein n=2 Tax=Compostibacter hankyongensis TaxID=1007089 RepID=A0ABP8FQB1_9BACT
MLVLAPALLFLILLSLVRSLRAQEKEGSILEGKVQTSEGAAAFVTVTLLNASDSSLVKGAVTDEAGHYRFSEVPAGQYLVCASMIGMERACSAPVRLDTGQQTVGLPLLTLRPGTHVLQGVHVKAARPYIEHKPGQTIVNVENSIVSAGNTALEVLEKSPGVTVDKDGNISLNGQSGVTVMINGRPTHLSSKQLTALLKGMSADALSQIELMTQPPSRYDAAGTGGMINLKMKKNAGTGFNGNLTVGGGLGAFPRYNAGGSLNYRNEHFSAYGNYNFNHDKDKSSLLLTRKFFSPGGKSLQAILRQMSEWEEPADNHNAQVGMDYFITPAHTLGFVLNGSASNSSFHSHSPVYFMDAAGKTDSLATSDNRTGGRWENLSANLHYTWDMDSAGQQLSFDADYAYFNMPGSQYIRTDFTGPEGDTLRSPEIRRGGQPTRVNIYSAKMDYTLPLKGNAKLEGGLKYSLAHTDNNSYFETLSGDKWQPDAGNISHFVYRENINAAYLNLSKTFKKGWSLQAGLRGEQTISRAEQLTIDSTVKRNYFQLFPNISLSRQLGKDNHVSLSYARRVDRPSYQDLNPMTFYVDKFTYQSGNPYLQPQFSHNIELSYTLKNRYIATLAYKRTDHIMTQVFRQIDSIRTTFITMGNLNSREDYTLNLNIPISITPWWSTNNNLLFIYQRFQGIYNDVPLDKGMPSFIGNTQQTFTLRHGWKAELNGMYRSTVLEGPLVVYPAWMLSFGIEKSLWDDRASLKLNVQDVFQTQNTKADMSIGNIDLYLEQRHFRRWAGLTFTWRFGNEKIKVNRHRNTGIEEEQNRIQRGN